MKQFRLYKAHLAFVPKLQYQILLILVLQWSTSSPYNIKKSDFYSNFHFFGI